MAGCRRIQRCQRSARPIPTFGPITWLDPAGNNHYNGLSARVEHRFGARPLFPEFVHLGRRRMGDSEQALEYYAGYYEANPQNIHNLAAEERTIQLRREVQQRHQRGVSASLRQGPQVRIAT